MHDLKKASDDIGKDGEQHSLYQNLLAHGMDLYSTTHVASRTVIPYVTFESWLEVQSEVLVSSKLSKDLDEKRGAWMVAKRKVGCLIRKKLRKSL